MTRRRSRTTHFVGFAVDRPATPANTPEHRTTRDSRTQGTRGGSEETAHAQSFARKKKIALSERSVAIHEGSFVDIRVYVSASHFHP